MAQTANSEGAEIDRIMARARSEVGGASLSIVRESALREGAVMLGARHGMRDKSCAIRKEIDKERSALDGKFRFSDLMMGRGILPPVISEAIDSVSLDATVMRVASRVYHIDEPARVVDIPPTWRDWLFVGLSADACSEPDGDIPEQLKPRTAAEEAWFRTELTRSYHAGRKAAQDGFASNLARLERAYLGMRRYFDLYARGMVSAPIVVASTDVVRRDDPNTLVVGNTVIRITLPADFVEKTETWKPLAP